MSGRERVSGPPAATGQVETDTLEHSTMFSRLLGKVIASCYYFGTGGTFTIDQSVVRKLRGSAFAGAGLE